MRKYICIAAGGMLGAMSRFDIKNINIDEKKNACTYIFGTFIFGIIGFIIGLEIGKLFLN